jgi:molybdopterin-guanine dinucleotide biosynthesis protein A
LEVLEGERLIDRGLAALGSQCDPLLVVANDLQPYFGVAATLVRDLIPDQGPLGGIYTALMCSATPWVLARAVDMPFLEQRLLTALIEACSETVDVVVPLVGEQYEPLFALYHRRCLGAIREVLAGTERHIIAFYPKVRVRVFPEAKWRLLDPEGSSFANINTLEEWQRWQ